MDRQTRSPEARSPIVDVRERVNSPALEVLSDGNPELPVPLEKGRPPVDLEVIIPAYNEEDRLPATLRGAVDYLARQPYTSSVVVVDNGSADLTADLAAFARQSRVRTFLVGCARQGKGAAIRRGVLTSRARWVGFIDADMATPMETLDRAIPLLDSGEKVVIASRKTAGASYDVEQDLTRRLGSAVFGLLASALVRGVDDTQCGFKFFDGDAARRLFSATSLEGFAFDVELLAFAQHFGYRICELPVRWTDQAGSTFSGLRHGTEVVRDLLGTAVRLASSRASRRQAPRPAAESERLDVERLAHAHLSGMPGLRVLFVNWRDRKHPQAGGAEVYAWELARRFLAAGADVSFFTSRPAGASAIEEDEGICVFRNGGRFTVYPVAAQFLLRNRHTFDVVIDCQNGIPFFVPLFARKTAAVVCVIHHVHQEQFAVHFRWPLDWVGRQLESKVARLVYGRRPLVAVSPSTRAAVRKRLALRGPIFVVPNGMAEPPGARMDGSLQRAGTPRILYLGRLVPQKRVDLLIRSMRAVLPSWPDVVLDIAGAGPEEHGLRALAADCGVAHAVQFHGYVSEEDKAELLRCAWLTVNPSMAEGWGISVIEANYYGDPAVACRVPGLRDSIRDGVTGWLVDDPAELSAALTTALDTLADEDVAADWADRCQRWACAFSWDESAERLAGVAAAELGDRRGVNVRYRRDPHRSDINCVARFTVRDPKRFAATARTRLRPTDLWQVNERDGRAAVLLYGADEVDALHVLDSLGITDDVDLRIATSSDLLVGPALRLEDEAISPTGERRELRLPAGDDNAAASGRTFAGAGKP